MGEIAHLCNPPPAGVVSAAVSAHIENREEKMGRQDSRRGQIESPTERPDPRPMRREFPRIRQGPEGSGAQPPQFTDDRLRLQQQQILHKLQHVQRSARVITFPGREMAAAHGHATVRVAPRWLAAAAAACLCVGAGLGAWVGPWRAAAKPVPAQAAMVQLPAAVVASPAVLVSTAKADADDDAFLMELELALAAPHTRELQAFDALTPHVRDIEFRER